jgi:predicted ester cyclase
MSKEVNLATLGKFAEAVNTGNFDLFKEVVAPECVDHDPAPGQASGPDGYRMFFSQMRTAFPDFKVALEALVADDESIAIAYTLTGTGPLGGITPTGRKMKIRACSFPNSKMARWSSVGEVRISWAC